MQTAMGCCCSASSLSALCRCAAGACGHGCKPSAGIGGSQVWARVAGAVDPSQQVEPAASGQRSAPANGLPEPPSGMTTTREAPSSSSASAAWCAVAGGCTSSAGQGYDGGRGAESAIGRSRGRCSTTTHSHPIHGAAGWAGAPNFLFRDLTLSCSCTAVATARGLAMSGSPRSISHTACLVTPGSRGREARWAASLPACLPAGRASTPRTRTQWLSAGSRLPPPPPPPRTSASRGSPRGQPRSPVGDKIISIRRARGDAPSEQLSHFGLGCDSCLDRGTDLAVTSLCVSVTRLKGRDWVHPYQVSTES
jgi:hypothetical protein